MYKNAFAAEAKPQARIRELTALIMTP